VRDLAAITTVDTRACTGAYDSNGVTPDFYGFKNSKANYFQTAFLESGNFGICAGIYYGIGHDIVSLQIIEGYYPATSVR
jgi:hypothetical protein